MHRTGLMTPPGITCFNEVFQISLEWGLFFYALIFLFLDFATSEVDFERWAQHFLALYIKTTKPLETFVSPVRADLKFPRAYTGKNPFRAHESSAQSGGSSETEVIGERKDLYILLDLRWPGAISRSPSFANCFRCLYFQNKVYVV